MDPKLDLRSQNKQTRLPSSALTAVVTEAAEIGLDAYSTNWLMSVFAVAECADTDHDELPETLRMTLRSSQVRILRRQTNSHGGRSTEAEPIASSTPSIRLSTRAAVRDTVERFTQEEHRFRDTPIRR